jgi:hypothetical protein
MASGSTFFRSCSVGERKIVRAGAEMVIQQPFGRFIASLDLLAGIERDFVAHDRGREVTGLEMVGDVADRSLAVGKDGDFTDECVSRE